MMENKSLFSKLKSAVPQPSIPTLGRTVDIPVYLIHNSEIAEDYFFIFDFEQFVERSRSGRFVRPKLKVWAGRDDFSKSEFARQFRESFAREFDNARTTLKHSKESTGWFSWNSVKDLVSSGGSSFVANVVLLVGVSASKMVWDALPLPKVFAEKSKETTLEDAIAATQTKVDEALSAMEITLHKQLWDHALKHGAVLETAGLDFDAWPLPQQVVEHLEDGKSQAWW